MKQFFHQQVMKVGSSQFPIPNSQFPIPNSQFPTTANQWSLLVCTLRPIPLRGWDGHELDSLGC